MSEEKKEKKSTSRLYCYTDGSRLGKGGKGPAGAGVAIYLLKKKPDPDMKLVEENSTCLGIETNQVAELRAVEIALDMLEEIASFKKHKFESHWKIKIISDSKYAIGMISEGWKAKKNIELVARIVKKWKQWTTVTHKLGETKMKWVKGHAGDKGNQHADELATAASAKVKANNDEESSSEEESEDDF